MKRLALRSALSARAAEEAVAVIDSIDWTEPKTRQARDLLAAVGADRKTLVVLNRTDTIAAKSFRNLPQVSIVEPGHVTAYDVLSTDRVVFTSHTVGAVGAGNGGYAVSESDFVKEADGEGGEGS
jgi:large subunit ribosomal protein L4